MEVAFAASMKCSEMMFRQPVRRQSVCREFDVVVGEGVGQGRGKGDVHSPVSTRLRSVSFALSMPPAKPTMKIGGSWLTICV